MAQKVYTLTLYLTDGSKYEECSNETTTIYATKDLAIEAALGWIRKQGQNLKLYDLFVEQLISRAKKTILTRLGVDVSSIVQCYSLGSGLLGSYHYGYLYIREKEFMQEPIFNEKEEEPWWGNPDEDDPPWNKDRDK